jgi:hypothetical protein
MKKAPTNNRNNEMRGEHDLKTLRSGVRGKYFKRAAEASNLVLIEPDLAPLFPDADSVNRALRLLAETARVATTSKRGSAGPN